MQEEIYIVSGNCIVKSCFEKREEEANGYNDIA